MPANAQPQHTFRKASLLSTTMALVLMLGSSPAHAEDTAISATGKGITGGTLLGAEVVTGTEAAFGIKSTWAYVIGGVAGAAAGGVGGYYIEQMDSPKPSFYLLAAGMALVIPTTVAVLQATAYEPPANYVEDQPGPDSTPQDTSRPPTAVPEGTQIQVSPPTPGPQQPGSRSPRPLPTRHWALRVPSATPTPVALSLVELSPQALRLGLPAPELCASYSTAEVRKFGLEQRSELRIPVFRATF